MESLIRDLFKQAETVFKIQKDILNTSQTSYLSDIQGMIDSAYNNVFETVAGLSSADYDLIESTKCKMKLTGIEVALLKIKYADIYVVNSELIKRVMVEKDEKEKAIELSTKRQLPTGFVRGRSTLQYSMNYSGNSDKIWGLNEAACEDDYTLIIEHSSKLHLLSDKKVCKFNSEDYKYLLLLQNKISELCKVEIGVKHAE